MKKTAYSAPDGAPAIGPYSPAVGTAGLVFLSGQIPLGADGKMVGFTAPDQARKALENMRALLAATA